MKTIIQCSLMEEGQQTESNIQNTEGGLGMKCKLFGIIVILIISWPLNSSYADSDYKEYKVKRIRVINGSAVMNFQDKGLIFDTSGTIGSEGIPEIISIGDVITIKGKTVKVNHIIVTEWKDGVYCTAINSIQDFPNENLRDRLWIYIKKCDPIR